LKERGEKRRGKKKEKDYVVKKRVYQGVGKRRDSQREEGIPQQAESYPLPVQKGERERGEKT